MMPGSLLSHLCRPMRRETTMCFTSCWQVWTTGTSRSSTCRELRPITIWTRYITHTCEHSRISPGFQYSPSPTLIIHVTHLFFHVVRRVVPVSWTGSRTKRTSNFWSSALTPLASTLTRSPLSGPSCPPSCSSATSASAPTRCVCVGERESCSERMSVSHRFLFQSESFEVSRIFSEAEARRVGSLLQISSEALQTVITHRVTVSIFSGPSHAFTVVNVHSDQLCNSQETAYDRIYCPLSVESAIESR